MIKTVINLVSWILIMKIVFLSGVKFGFEILNQILEEKFDIHTVFSYDETKKTLYSDFASFDTICNKFGIKHVKINNINDPINVQILKSIQPDLILVMGWSQLLKDEILSIPKFGVIGSHPSELPKYRGRAPIPWTILKNLKESALTFFYIEEGIDDGDIIDQQKFKIEENDDATIIYNKIIEIGKIMIIKNLKLIQNNSILRTKQKSSEFVEYWEKRTPKDGLINWNNSSKEIYKLIRATTHPYPGAFSFFNKKKLKIFKAKNLNNKISDPGKIISIDSDGVSIGTRNGVIILQSIEFENDFEKNATLLFSINDIGKILDSGI